MFARIYWVTALLVLPLCTGREIKPYIPRAIPCPPDADILPCVCTVQSSVDMYMDCSAVTSSEELRTIFSINFPFVNFIRLDIIGNTALTELRAGDLGPTTYKEIYITGGVLEIIDENALSGSYSTLTTLDLQSNELTSFQFDEISSFEALHTLRVDDNDFKIFPDISSTSLLFLSFGSNPLGAITNTALTNMPNLIEVDLQNCSLTDVPAGTFTGLRSLEMIHLDYNSLTSIDTNVISLSSSYSIVYLNNNQIANIAPGALEGVKTEVWLQNNQMTVLDEELWRPLFNGGLVLFASNNPLTCDCSIAWLVLQGTYLSLLGDSVTCADGEPVKTLDPAIYVAMCT
nr:oplophorus-luciferin 2-monooxygenase non-catalytic subunit-like isoform X1 [Cherax quadricarinatus]